MSKKIVIVVAQEGFRDEELLEPKALFEEHGYSVLVASPQKGICKGMLGAILESDISIDDIIVDKSLGALIVVGGANAPSLMNISSLGDKLSKAKEMKVVIGAICIAPMIVASFGIIDDFHSTVFKSDESMAMFKDHKITYFQEDVLVDDLFVSASGPHAATIFAEEIVDLL